jgi:negative regulator of genetic competence, sporulation and motility
MAKLYQPQHEQLLNKIEGINQLTNKIFITVADLIARIINDEDQKKISAAWLPQGRIKRGK